MKPRQNFVKALFRGAILTLGLAGLVVNTAGCSTPDGQQRDATSQASQSSAESASAKQTRPEVPHPELRPQDLVLWLYADNDQLGVENGQVTEWRDASGRDNHLAAPGESPRPNLERGAIGERNALRFDGEDDLLMRDGFEPDQVASVTLFIVAAPSGNSGEFDGLVSAGRRGDDDLWTGFNVDLGGKNVADCAADYPDSVGALNTVNIQSAKSRGDCGRDFLEASKPLDKPVILTVHIDSSKTQLRIDGQPQVDASGGSETLDLVQLRLGARYHHQRFQGFYKGMLAEVIAYKRSLSDDEAEQVESYLAKWYGIDLAR